MQYNNIESYEILSEEQKLQSGLKRKRNKESTELPENYLEDLNVTLKKIKISEERKVKTYY